MKHMPTMLRRLMPHLSVLLLVTCSPRPEVDQVQRLLAHPQFTQAREAAPEWSKDALTTINDQQREIQKLKAPK